MGVGRRRSLIVRVDTRVPGPAKRVHWRIEGTLLSDWAWQLQLIRLACSRRTLPNFIHYAGTPERIPTLFLSDVNTPRLTQTTPHAANSRLIEIA